MKVTKRKLIYHTISIVFLLSIVLVGSLVFTPVFYRTWEAVRDFGLSIAYYFQNFFDTPSTPPPVVAFPKELIEVFPRELEKFTAGMERFSALFLDRDNLSDFFHSTLHFLYVLSKILLFAFPVLLALVLLVHVLNKRKTSDVKTSKPLRIFFSFRRRILLPAKQCVLRYFKFLRKHKVYGVLAAIMIAFFFNALTIALEAIAFYLYFVVSFDVVNLYVQFVKLLSDLAPIFLKVPLPLLLIVGAVIFDKLRKRRALARLNGFEDKNQAFIGTLPIVTMINGTMGKGKTTLSTDIARSTEVILREEAKDRITDIDLKFHSFPWIALERFVARAMRRHTVYNIASVSKLFCGFRAAHAATPDVRRAFLRKLKRNYGYHYSDLFFGYDPSFGIEHDDFLTISELFKEIEKYALLYFIYSSPTSMIISNYAIRSERFLDTNGQFPTYKSDFFDRPAARVEDSNLSHIIHFDSFRLGTKKKEDNPYKNAFEYGVVVITEIGKERGNRNDMEGVKKDADDCNQKNDMFNAALKLIRHSATVDNYPFVRIITDEQRPENWGADARDLCTLLEVRSVSDKKIILPFFFFEEALYLLARKLFQSFYQNYRYNRADTTLSLYLIKSLFVLIHTHYKRTENRFSVRLAKLRMQAGTQDGASHKIRYYLCTKKAYANAFSTDCYSAFFKSKAALSPVGINDMPTFRDVQPSVDELADMESHFMNDVIEVFRKGRDGFNPSAPDKKSKRKR